MAKIGVFDSGIGGLSVARAIEKALPEDEIIFLNDTKNVPYGSKTNEQLIELVTPLLKKLEEQGCELIVVACNTVSCTVLPQIKKQLHIPVVGVVPMVKTAVSMSSSHKIAVCATPATLKSRRYAELKKEFAANTQVLEPDCSEWALLIEKNEMDKSKVRLMVEEVCEQGADVIVLGCTHYHWIQELIEAESAGRAHILQPEPAIVAEVKRVLERTP